MSPSGYCECSHNNLPLMYILPRRKKKQEYALHFLSRSYAVADEHIAGYAFSATAQTVSCHAERTRSISFLSP